MKKEIINHFKNIDLRILDLIAKYEITLPKKSSSDKYYVELTKNIAYQQLTDKAAKAIYSRLTDHFKTEQFKPSDILKLDVEQLRSFGFSYSKSNYILNIANASKQIDFEKLDELSDKEIVKQLTSIKGVGQWTAQMFLLFTLGRENIFAPNDLGLKKAIMKLDKLKELPSEKEMIEISKEWEPYKSYVTLALWKYLDNR